MFLKKMIKTDDDISFLLLIPKVRLLVIGASVSEPHTSESNSDFSYIIIIIIIIFWRTSFRIFSML